MSEPLTSRSLPGYLERSFSGYSPMVEAVRGLNHTVAVTADLLISEVFVDQILADAMASGNRALLAECFAALEHVLSSPDELLQMMFADYVSPVLVSTDRWARVTQEMAGPLLGRSLDASAGSSWRRRTGGFGSDQVHEPPASVMVSGYLYREQTLWHARRHLAGTSVPLTEPFARLDARSGAYSLGVTVAKLLDSLSRPVDEAPRHEGDRFMAFVGCDDWTAFYAESLTVEIEGLAGSHAVSVWPIHKAERGGPHLQSWPDKPLPVTYWRDASDFGATILAAFGVARTAGGRHQG